MKKHWNHIAIGVLTAILCVIIIVLINAFSIGRIVENPDLIQAEVTVNNRHIALSGTLTDFGKGVADVKFTNKEGVVKATITETLKSSFHRNDFHAEYVCDSVISQIWLGDRIIWDNGETVTSDIAKLYETKHPYLGDASANNETAMALGIWKDIGNYSNELQTDKEPYGWKLLGEQDYAVESRDKVEAQMTSYASALIALIDNLGSVTFEYTVEGEAHALSIAERDADTRAGQSIKEMAKTPGGLQRLMKNLNLTEGYNGSRIQEYFQNEDGTWSCKGAVYKYRITLSGRDRNAEADGRFVVLTDKPDITYEEVSQSLRTSLECADSKETIIVEIGGD